MVFFIYFINLFLYQLDLVMKTISYSCTAEILKWMSEFLKCIFHNFSLSVTWSKDCKYVENPECIIFWFGLLQVHRVLYACCFSCQKLKHEQIFDLTILRLVDIKITFQLKGINLQTVRHRELPDCYSFYVTVNIYFCVQRWKCIIWSKVQMCY